MGRARRDVKGISMKQGFFLKAYGMLWRVLIPFLRRNKRLADGWEERRVPVDWLAHVPWAMRERRGCDVWLQAASGGEARLALAVLEALPERASGTGARDNAWRVLLITWTRQGRDVLEAGVARIGALRRDMLCAVRFAPLDEPATALRALELAEPRVLALLETELWPGLMAACRETGVPLAVLNGRMTNTSYECYRVLRNVLRDMPPRRVLAMCGEDLSRFCGIFDGAGNPPCRLELIPNIKFDLALHTLDRACQSAAEPLPEMACGGNLRLLFGTAPLALFASTREQEENRLCPRILELRRKNPACVIVLAPRHMHRVEAWRSRFYDLGIPCVLASSLNADAPCESLAPEAVVLWDRFGDLPHLYAAADAVYVGGGFGQGGQNFLEALAGGVVPCVGPRLGNFLWALGDDCPPALAEAGLLRICRRLVDVRDYMLAGTRARRTEGEREAVRARFRTWLEMRTGGSRRTAQVLAQMLEERNGR